MSAKMAVLNNSLVTISLAIRMRDSEFSIEVEGSKHSRIMLQVKIWVLKECGYLRKMYLALQ